MENNLAENATKIIDNLADKFGVAADKVYPILIKQAQIEGIKSILAALVSMAIIAVSCRMLIKTVKNLKFDRFGFCDTEDEIKIWLLVAALAVFIVIAFMSLSNAIDAIGNPEWYAFKMVMEMIK